MFASVIAAVDESEASGRAVAAGSLVARATWSPLVLAHVAVPGTSAERAWLVDLAAGARAPSCATTVVSDVSPAEGLLRLQAARPDSLLCLATAARAGIGEIVFGSTAATVVRRTTRPVLLVGPRAKVAETISTILVALDGSEEAEAGAISAGVWALRLHARLHLVRVAPPSVPGAPHDQVTDLAAVADELRRNLAVHAEWDVLHRDSPVAAIIEHATDLSASLLVLTTSARGDAVERLVGSTSTRIVHDAPCPVLLVRHRQPT